MKMNGSKTEITSHCTDEPTSSTIYFNGPLFTKKFAKSPGLIIDRKLIYKNHRMFSVCAPRLSGRILFAPPDARAIFLNSGLLRDGTCSVTGGAKRTGGATNGKDPNHLDNAIRKGEKSWNAIQWTCSMRWGLTFNTETLVYKTFIQPQHIFASSMWARYLFKKQRVQQNCILGSIFKKVSANFCL